ncbi:kinase domain protein [Aspergillus heterothallicus]
MLRSAARALSALRVGRRWQPLDFSNSNVGHISVKQAIEEETLPGYIIGKLGYGATSTAWLARDMKYRTYATVKIYVKAASMGQQLENEVNMYQHVTRESKHPGCRAIRTLTDSFHIEGPEDKHQCLVHPALFESVWEFLLRNPVQRLLNVVLAFTLRRLFLALDYLHTECQISHTDIKADNIMFELADDLDPSPRKEIDGRTIYLSQNLEMIPGKIGAPVLCDFRSAVSGGVKHTEDVQPDVYRAPEIILEVPWSCSIDIWKVGCMIWNIFEGGSFFTGQDPEFKTYRSRAHLAEMINLLGPPPVGLLARANQGKKFFTEDGEFRHGDLNKASFLRMMRRMLQWEPEKRSSARDLAQDEWIRKQIGM